MSRYIKADALKENCYKQMDKLMESTSEHLSAEALSLLCGFTLIDSAPSIDIVFCKECKHAHMTYGGDCKYCDMWKDDDDFCIELYLDGDFYCAYGERKESE